MSWTELNNGYGVTQFYEVYVRWTSAPARSQRAEIVVTHQGGVSRLFADQRTGGGQWQLLGVFPFQAGGGGSVEMLAPRNQRVSADAVRFLRVPPPPP